MQHLIQTKKENHSNDFEYSILTNVINRITPTWIQRGKEKENEPRTLPITTLLPEEEEEISSGEG
jgi:hypothetical protein